MSEIYHLSKTRAVKVTIKSEEFISSVRSEKSHASILLKIHSVRSRCCSHRNLSGGGSIVSIQTVHSTSVRSVAWPLFHHCSPNSCHSTCQYPSILLFSHTQPWDKYSADHRTRPDESVRLDAARGNKKKIHVNFIKSPPWQQQSVL